MYSLCVCVVFRLNLVNSTKMVVWKEFVTKSVGLGQQQQVRQEISHQGTVFRVCSDRHTGRNYQGKHNETFQLVPLKKVLKKFLEQPGIMSSILHQHGESDENVLQSYRDGTYFKEIFNPGNETFIPINLYSDDFETANPLGSRKGIHKVMAVYIAFPCLSPQHQASTKNILLAALCQTRFVNKYGMDCVLEPIVNQLKDLEKTGISIESKDHYVGIIKPRLFQVIGDNLALNSMLGYVTSFRANFYCRICKMHRDQTHLETVEKEELLRTEGNFTRDLNVGNFSLTGVRYNTILNSLQQYHVVQNVAMDAMHDFLEGILPFEMKLVLYELFSGGQIDLHTLNSRIQTFNFGFTDKKNRPSLAS